MSGALVVRGRADQIPLPDKSVDLIVTSPPYFGQRSYKDGDEHMAGQVGDEPTPQEFLEALWSSTSEWWRVLKDEGSAFVNLGDKRSGSGAPGTTSGLSGQAQGDRTGIDVTTGYTRAAFGRPKSKQLLPQRYAVGCEDGAADPDGIGWIVRAELIWWKRNGLPESVRDRARDAHEVFWHLTKTGDYYAAIDELRQPHMHEESPTARRGPSGIMRGMNVGATHEDGRAVGNFNHSPLGRIPDDVWPISLEPLRVPAHLGIDHFAAFPSEWPRRLVLGWSPPGICLECGEGRRPATDRAAMGRAHSNGHSRGLGTEHSRETHGLQPSGRDDWNEDVVREIVGYVCVCTPFEDVPREARSQGKQNKDPRHTKWDGAEPGQRATFDRIYDLERWTPPPTRPAVVLDPFGGTGTTAMVARALGRRGISLDLSMDYCRLARWRIFESGYSTRIEARTNAERQGMLAL